MRGLKLQSIMLLLLLLLCHLGLLARPLRLEQSLVLCLLCIRVKRSELSLYHGRIVGRIWRRHHLW